MKIFLDANVIFTAAHNPSGKAAFLLRLKVPERWKLVTCVLAMEEAERNLPIKFPKGVGELKKIVGRMGLVATVVEGECPIELPPKDTPIFLSARQAGCSHLLTGDLKDFGRFMNQPKKSGGILIQTVNDFLTALR
ncbi:MAG: hypothetical protein HYZ71_02600 [Deltaproteobacteria bacterium]|nr:hypothetical protein [Deltaproteobacteria bacterium]